jgi:hypothetical protein
VPIEHVGANVHRDLNGANRRIQELDTE